MAPYPVPTPLSHTVLNDKLSTPLPIVQRAATIAETQFLLAIIASSETSWSKVSSAMKKLCFVFFRSPFNEYAALQRALAEKQVVEKSVPQVTIPVGMEKRTLQELEEQKKELEDEIALRREMEREKDEIVLRREMEREEEECRVAEVEIEERRRRLSVEKDECRVAEVEIEERRRRLSVEKDEVCREEQAVLLKRQNARSLAVLMVKSREPMEERKRKREAEREAKEERKRKREAEKEVVQSKRPKVNGSFAGTLSAQSNDVVECDVEGTVGGRLAALFQGSSRK